MTHNIPEFLKTLAACWTKSTIQRTGPGQYTNYDISFGYFLELLAEHNKLTIQQLSYCTDTQLQSKLTDYLNYLIDRDYKEKSDVVG